MSGPATRSDVEPSCVSFVLNGEKVRCGGDSRTSLADLLRHGLNRTGTHVGCEHGVCGACTVWVDGEPVRACITLAAAVDGQRIRSIEGFEHDPTMAALRESFSEAHGLQCGYCTPGMLLTAHDMLTRGCCGSEEQIRRELAGNLCRCTGYAGIVKAIVMTRDRLAENRS